MKRTFYGNEDEEDENIFSTRDIGLAATLITLNFQIIGIDYQVEGIRNLPIGYFQFEPTKEVKEATEKYWSGQLAVEPRTFQANIRGLKAQTSGKYNSPHSKF